MALFERERKNGAKVWAGETVNLYEAMQRKRRGEPVIKRTSENGGRFLFSIASRDIIELDDQSSGGRELFVVRSIESDSKKIRFVPIKDARKLKDIGKAGFTAVPSSLRSRNCSKVVVTPLGDIRSARD
jgi:CRISPR-associated endonuclease Csn1